MPIDTRRALSEGQVSIPDQVEPSMIGAKITKDAPKFLVVSVFAFVVDLIIVALLLANTGLSSYSAMIAAYVAVAVAVYFVHEFWTFRSAGSIFSFTRLVKTVTIALFSLSVRVAFLFILKMVVQSDDWRVHLALIAIASGASLTVNFILNSRNFSRSR